MAASVATKDSGRYASIIVNFSTGGDAYATASGGAPFDLAAVLNAGAGDGKRIHPARIVGVRPVGFSTAGYAVGALTVGTYTWATDVPFGTQTSPAVPAMASVHPAQKLATCPVWVRLHAIGASAANHAVLGEAADGALTDTFTAELVYKLDSPTL